MSPAGHIGLTGLSFFGLPPTFVVEEAERGKGGVEVLLKLAEGGRGSNRICWSCVDTSGRLPPSSCGAAGAERPGLAAARRRQINCHVLVLINYQKARSTISLSEQDNAPGQPSPAAAAPKVTPPRSRMEISSRDETINVPAANKARAPEDTCSSRPEDTCSSRPWPPRWFGSVEAFSLTCASERVFAPLESTWRFERALTARA